MKGVVMDYKDGYAVILREDGVFEKIQKEYKRGDTIELEENLVPVTHTRQSVKALRFTRQIAGIAAAALLFSGVGYHGMTVEAYSYVTVDVNPSIEYTLNRFDKVIGAEALNEEAEHIVSELDYSGKDLTTVMEQTESLLEENGYLNADDTDYVLMSVVSKGDKHRAKIEDEMTRFKGEEKRMKDDIIMTSSSMDDRRMAREQGVSTGRYGEMKRYEEKHHDMPPKDCPVEELLRRNERIPEPKSEKPDEKR